MLVPMWKCSVVCLNQSAKALLCGNVCACTNVPVLCCVLISVRVPLWHCPVLCESEYLYQIGNDLFCDILSACINVAVFCCVIP